MGTSPMNINGGCVALVESVTIRECRDDDVLRVDWLPFFSGTLMEFEVHISSVESILLIRYYPPSFQWSCFDAYF